MSTTLATPSANNAKMRWTEPYVSDGLNAKMNGIVPSGVVRGGRLETGGAALLLTIKADSNTGDSVYSYIDSNGRQITFRQIGDVTLDLNTGGVPGTTVYIGLEITYVVSAPTLVYWRAYSDVEIGADPSLVVLGQVVVPLVGPIPAANVTPLGRRDAWLSKSGGIQDWLQIVLNGSFEAGAAGQITSNPETEPLLWVSDGMLSGGVEFWTDQTNPRSGKNCLKVLGAPPHSNTSTIYNERYVAVRPGQFIRASMWVSGNLVSAGGFGVAGVLAIGLHFLNSDLQPVSDVYVCNAGQEDGTFSYKEFSEIVEAPALTDFMRISIRASDATTTMTGSYFVDDVRVWLESGIPTEDDVRERILIDGETPGRSLDIAPWNDSPGDIQEWLSKVLRLRFDDFDINGVMEYEWKHRLGIKEWLLKLLSGGIKVDRLIEDVGSTLIGTPDDAALPRISSPYRSNSWLYTLMWEMENTATRGWIRIYVSDTAYGTNEAIVITNNAKWNASLTRWERDQNTRDSSRFDISASKLWFCFYDDALADTWTDLQWWTVGNSELLLTGGTSSPYPRMTLSGTGSYGFNYLRDGNYLSFVGSSFDITCDGSSNDWERTWWALYPLIPTAGRAILNFEMLKSGDYIQQLFLFTSYSTGTGFDWELYETEYYDPAAGYVDTILASGTTGTTVGNNTDKWTIGDYVSKNATSELKIYYLVVYTPTVLGAANRLEGAMIRYTTNNVYV